ncbi:hypothetical protein ACEPAG_357 [Sanghuangporus baumii]
MMANSFLEDNLHQHLLNIEGLQLSAMDANPEAIGELVKSLSEAQSMTKRCISQGSLTRRTLAFARSIACVGKALANHLLGIEQINSDVGTKRRAEMEAAMERLSLENSSTISSSTDSASSEVAHSIMKSEASPTTLANPSNAGDAALNPKADSFESSTSAPEICTKKRPTHISQSYEWLLAHLHNPYPTVSVKKRIASEAGVSVKTIEDWFTNTRRRIGWTSIVQKHFRNSRSEAIDCALSVLNGERARQPFKPEQYEALLAMKASALSLFEKLDEGNEAIESIEAVIKRSKTVVQKESGQKMDGTSEMFLLSEKRSVGGVTNSSTSGMSIKQRYSRKRRYSIDGGHAQDETCRSMRPSKRKRSSPVSKHTNDSLASFPSVESSSLPSNSGQSNITDYASSPTISKDCPRSSRKRTSASLVEDEPTDKYDVPLAKKFRESDPKGLVERLDLNFSDNLTHNEGSYTSSAISSDGTDGSMTSSPSSSLLTVLDESIEGSSPSPPNDACTSAAFNFKDLFDLPDMPTFTWDGSDILPPSFEPIPLSADFSVSHLELNDDPSHCLPGLADSDSSWLSSLEFNICSESKLDSLAQISTNVQQPESDAALFSDFFQDFFCSQDNLRSDHSGGKTEEL